MYRKPLELTPDVAIAFVEDMRALFAVGDKHKQDAIAVRQLNALSEHQGPLDTPLGLSDVKAMFLETKDIVG